MVVAIKAGYCGAPEYGHFMLLLSIVLGDTSVVIQDRVQREVPERPRDKHGRPNLSAVFFRFSGDTV